MSRELFRHFLLSATCFSLNFGVLKLSMNGVQIVPRLFLKEIKAQIPCSLVRLDVLDKLLSNIKLTRHEKKKHTVYLPLKMLILACSTSMVRQYPTIKNVKIMTIYSTHVQYFIEIKCFSEFN